MKRLTVMLSKNFWKLPGLWLRLCHYAKHAARYPESVKYGCVQYIFQQASCSGNVQLEIFGTENIPQQGSFMMYANHQGKFDSVAIAASCDTPIGVVMKKELCGNPFMKRVMACTGSFGMDRENVRQSLEVINRVTQQVQQGRSFLIFPEGEANRCSNRVGEFHPGCFRCALRTGCPVLPVALVDCFKPMDFPGSHPVTVQVHYLKPITQEEYRGMTTRELSNLVHSRICQAISLHTPSEKTAV